MTVDFSLLHTLKSIVFIDESTFEIRPELPLVEVKFPTLEKEHQVLVKANEVNLLNTKLLCYNKNIIEFPDGVYEIKYSVSPHHLLYKIKKTVRFEKAKEKIKQMLEDKDLTDQLKKELYDLDVYMLGAEVFVEKDIEKSLEFFNLVQKKLKCVGSV